MFNALSKEVQMTTLIHMLIALIILVPTVYLPILVWLKLQRNKKEEA